MRVHRSETVGFILRRWCVSAGWGSLLEDPDISDADLADSMESSHCQERSLADLVASGGLPEAQALAAAPAQPAASDADPAASEQHGRAGDAQADSERCYRLADDFARQIEADHPAAILPADFEERVFQLLVSAHADPKETR